MPREVDNWLASYMEYSKTHEAPEVFHFWTAAAVLSGAIRRNIWLDRGFYKLFPNLYIVLIAESAKLRKSTAIGIGIPLLRGVEEAQIIHERITAEKLIECLNRNIRGQPDGTAFILAPELTVFLGGDDLNSRKLIAFLVSVHEGKDEWEYATIARDRRTLKNVLLTVIGASTPEWMRQIPEDAVGGGFAGRVIWVGAEKRRFSVAWPKVTKEEQDLKIKLTKTLQVISELRGEFTVSMEAYRLFDEWYGSIAEPDDPRIAGFIERMHDQALRVGMILSVAEGNSLVLEGAHIKRAIELLEGVARFMPRVLSFVGTSEHSRDAERILGQLQRAQRSELPHGQLLAMNSWKLSAEDFRKVMQTLSERDEVEVIEVGRKTIYKVKGGRKK